MESEMETPQSAIVDGKAEPASERKRARRALLVDVPL